MNTISNAFAELSDWLPVLIPLACVAIYFAIQSRWDAYSRKKAFEELKLLNDLRQRGILTQEEFDEKKEALLCI